MNLHRTALVLAVIAVLTLLALVVKIDHCTYGYTCRVCGATQCKEVLRAAGVTLRTEYRGVIEHEDRVYERLIGEPHEHQWCGGGFGGTSGSLILRGRCEYDGRHHFGPYSFLQPRLTDLALNVAKALEGAPQDLRSEVYGLIRDASTEEGGPLIGSVNRDPKAFDPGTAEQFWRQWLATRGAHVK